MRLAVVLATACVAALASAGSAQAQGVEDSPVIFVMDISGSMSEEDSNGDVKIESAKDALQLLLTEVGLEQGTPMGLRTYPDQSGESCNSGTSRFPIAPRDPDAMSALVRSLRPSGDTPTAEALRSAAADMQAAGYEQARLVLVSDGHSTCDPPCDAAREIARAGVIESFIIGFDLTDEEGMAELQCIAEATGGVYVDIGDGEALEDAFRRLSRPVLEIELEDIPPVAAEVGFGDAGLVRVEATITNASDQDARNVQARLRFDSLGPVVLRPVIHLGNLEARGSRQVVWEFRPGVRFQGETIGFRVIAGAENALSDAEARGSVRVLDESDPSHAGPILRNRRLIAILGDSYSSGEGADDYLLGTDTMGNKCHRSMDTYLVRPFSLPSSSIVACSGAVLNNIEHVQGQAGGDVPSQFAQLSALANGRGVDAVVLTLVGNDARFSTVALSCLLPWAGCSTRIYMNPLLRREPVPVDQFLAERLNEELRHDLADGYGWIHSALNSPGAVARRGSVAPILVLAYPLPIPARWRSCEAMFDLLDENEVRFVGQRFLPAINGLVEGAVREARADGVPVFYIAETEGAFQSNTVCDRDPYARPLTSFDGASAPGLLDLPSLFDFFQRSKNELLHPNDDGYRAMSRAIVKWSQTSEGQEAAAFLERASAEEESLPGTTISSLDLGQLEGGGTLTVQEGTSYPLTAGGFVPESEVEVVIRSELRVLAQVEADDEGRIDTRVGIPSRTDPGRHMIEVAGPGQDGTRRLIEIPVRVEDDGLPVAVKAIALGAAATGIAALLAALAAGVGYLRLRRRPREEPMT